LRSTKRKNMKHLFAALYLSIFLFYAQDLSAREGYQKTKVIEIIAGQLDTLPKQFTKDNSYYDILLNDAKIAYDRNNLPREILQPIYEFLSAEIDAYNKLGSNSKKLFVKSLVDYDLSNRQNSLYLMDYRKFDGQAKELFFLNFKDSISYNKSNNHVEIVSTDKKTISLTDFIEELSTVIIANQTK